MPVTVHCHCGQTFSAKDELIGQTLLCPKCSSPLTIGAPKVAAGAARGGGGISDLFDEVGLKEVRGPRCPACGEGLKPNAVICVACGFHLQTGQKLAADVPRRSSGGHAGHGVSADDLLRQAELAIEVDKVEQKKNRSQGAPWFVYLIALAVIVGFAIAMVMIPQETAFKVTGIIIAVFGGLVQLYCGIRMLVAAFSESTSCGLMYILVPFYSLYYIFTRWDQVGSFFLLSIGGGMIQAAGFGVIAVGPYLASQGEEEVRALPPPPARERRVELAAVIPPAWPS